MKSGRSGERRRLVLPWLIAAGVISHGAVALAQSQYQQDQQFPSQQFNFQEVSWLATGPGGHLYLLQRGGLDLTIWTSAGTELRGLFPNQLAYPHSVRVRQAAGGENHIWVTDMAPPGQQVVPVGHCVKEFSESGQLLRTIGRCGADSAGSGLDPVQFDKVTDIAFDSKGTRWISDGDVGGLNNRVLQLDTNGNVLQVWGGTQPGTGPGQFNLPHALDIDDCDRVFVADTLNHRIQVITTNGTFLQQLQCFGTDGVYGLRLSKPPRTGGTFLATTSSPTSSPTGGTVRLFPVAPSCTAPMPVPDGCAASAQWSIALPQAPMTAMLHSVDVGVDGSLYIATLGGDLPPQKWIPVGASRAPNHGEESSRRDK